MLLVQTVQRGVLLPVGGAVTDRMSPRTVMLCSHLVRGTAVGLLGVLAVTDGVRVWHLDALGAVAGVAYSGDVALPTFIQTRTPQDVPGRITSVMYLPRVVLEPLSLAVMGLLVTGDLRWAFAAAAAAPGPGTA
ncbi:hypothetical protein ACF065_34855 [Streptomyces sp. NPDC015232]|uniref:hypothetical protein n=1 Tax=unclassified Streptomyces TaxID=2593676 RepID=UPI0036F95C52